ncbi:hypothetical protein CHARACLAT_007907 [Characodon lateralis]|uniref:Uncharacterized protein n=1 Tax=Characodon lateralis TaxID=208331 RepID=A0ABU7CLC0_9TELE|nr:hypothetical protein [Characodon lateralis]
MEEYLSRRLPALRRQSDQAGSWQLPLSSGPRHKRTLFTLQRKYLHIGFTPGLTKLTQTAPEKSSEQTLRRIPGPRFPLPLAICLYLFIGDPPVHVPDDLLKIKLQFTDFSFLRVYFCFRHLNIVAVILLVL